MDKIITITFMILSVGALAYTPETTPSTSTEIEEPCIVMPEVIEACEQSGGRFDWKTCSCVGGGEAS